MDPAVLRKLERLANAGIEIVPIDGLTRHFVLARDGFAALVERASEDFGKIGAAGRVDERGFAALVWREREAFFVAKHTEVRATRDEVDGLRRFSSDLKQALTG
jgi:hypothetical protein